MATVTVNIDGMHCGACVRRVRSALEKVPGVTVREVEVGHATVEVGGDGGADGAGAAGAAASRQAVERAVTAAGFQPRPSAAG